jgi:hypothetical protein
MELLALLLYAEVHCDVVLSEVFNFKKRRDNVMVCLVENYYFPGILGF